MRLTQILRQRFGSNKPFLLSYVKWWRTEILMNIRLISFKGSKPNSWVVQITYGTTIVFVLLSLDGSVFFSTVLTCLSLEASNEATSLRSAFCSIAHSGKFTKNNLSITTACSPSLFPLDFEGFRGAPPPFDIDHTALYGLAWQYAHNLSLCTVYFKIVLHIDEEV